MRLLGYMQLRNEEIYARYALKSIMGIVDEMLVVLDRCEDNTMDCISDLLSQCTWTTTNSNAELIKVRESVFTDFNDFHWIIPLSGDEVFASSIKDIRDFIQRKPLDDSACILGHTIDILNEKFTKYTHPRNSRVAPSTNIFYNNKMIISAKASPAGYDKLNTEGPYYTFDARSGKPGECPTKYHMHNLERTLLKPSGKKHNALIDAFGRDFRRPLNLYFRPGDV